MSQAVCCKLRSGPLVEYSGRENKAGTTAANTIHVQILRSAEPNFAMLRAIASASTAELRRSGQMCMPGMSVLHSLNLHAQ